MYTARSGAVGRLDLPLLCEGLGSIRSPWLGGIGTTVGSRPSLGVGHQGLEAGSSLGCSLQLGVLPKP